MIEKSCLALKFNLILGIEKDVKSDFERLLAQVIVKNDALFDKSAVNLIEYLLLTIQCYTKN